MFMKLSAVLFTGFAAMAGPADADDLCNTARSLSGSTAAITAPGRFPSNFVVPPRHAEHAELIAQIPAALSGPIHTEFFTREELQWTRG